MTVINTNIKSMVARDALTINNRSLSTAMERLSTGKRVNSASDDAAGLAIGTRMDAQVRGLNMAIKNANDTISVTQTAEGAMQEITSILQRMRELAVQSSSDTNSTEDRAFLQQEVSQLSSEIDRISNTTQFNGMNLLDGSYANKKFQIGANQDQTIGMSIGRMNSNTLGVGSSVVGAPTPMNVPSANGVSGAVAAGTAAGPTSIKLGFSTNDTYTFTLADDVSGLAAAGATAVALDLTSSISKADFAKGINTKLAESAVDTKVTGSVTALGDATNVSTTPEAVKFSISIGGGAVKNIDLKNRLIGDGTGTLTAVTAARIKAALEAELQSQYDTSVTVTGTNATAFVITDAQGRSIDVTQGQGSGAIFGTDSANNGSLSATQNVQTNLSVAWDQGNNLIVTNKAGGKTTLAGYTTTGTATVVFDASASIPGQVQNPVVLAKTAASDPKVTANGGVEASVLAVNFSNRSDTSDVYKFKLTDGSGHVYADLSGAGLNVGKDISNATIIDAVKSALVTGTTAVTWVDKSITASDFDVQFSGSTLTVTNKEGLALAIEGFTSDAGYATATPMNELGKSTVLAQKQAYTSEARLGFNVASLATSNVAAVAGAFDLWIDGIKSTAGIDFSAALTKGTTGSAIATAMQTAIKAVADVAVGTTASKQDLSNITVDFDSTSGQMVIKDTNGRSVSLSAKSTNTYTGTGLVWVQDGVTGLANKVQTIRTSSTVAQGQLYNQTKMDVTLSADSITGLNFKLNGVALGATAVDFTQPFTGSALETNLNSMMASLNANHPTNSYEYSVKGRTITFAQRDGGALEFDNFATATPSEAVYASVTPAAGQGTAKTVNYNEALATAKALGNLATATNVKLKINSPDLVSLSISDGSKTYSLSPTAIDITDRTSTSNFVKALNKSLSGSNIVGSMDLSGNIYLTDTFGGKVSLTAFGTASGQGAAWTPSTGQGDALAINSGYVGSASAAAPAAAGGLSVGAGGSSVSQMSIGTQAGASAALATIDKALSYVNAERSKLGAIENRLTHTVDNLTNIVTNTAASKSRIVDTDYATETTELARAQIIAQASTAMLAQANQSAQGVLSLLK